MINYVVMSESGVVIGIMKNTQFDALRKIKKLLSGTGVAIEDEKKFLMPSQFKATVVCDPADKFDPEEGKRIAKERIMNRYYKSFDKKLMKIQDDIAEARISMLEYQLSL